MSKPAIFDKEPAAIIAGAAAAITGIVLTLSGNGFISDALAGKAVDFVEAVRQIAVIALPFLTAGLATRQAVYSPATVEAIAAGAPSSAVSGVDTQ